MLTVVTPAGDPTLLSVEETKAAVGVQGSAQDADIERLRRRVAAVIVRACKIPAAGASAPTLRQEVLREILRLPGQADELVLARRPIVAIAAATIDGVGLADSDFEADAPAGILHRLTGGADATWPRARIVVDYTAGWEEVPDDLKLAAAKLSLIIWSENGPNPVDPSLKREKIDGIIEFERWVAPASDPVLPRDVVDLLVPYCNDRIG